MEIVVRATGLPVKETEGEIKSLTGTKENTSSRFETSHLTDRVFNRDQDTTTK